MKERWIKVYEKLKQWEWYGDPNMVSTLLHLLLTANWKDKKWRGILIKRGQLITSRTHLADEIGISEQQTRTCLERLQASGVITCEATNKFTIITICNYDVYQDNEHQEQPATQPTTHPTNNQQSTNQTPTNNQQSTTTLEYIEGKEPFINSRKKESVCDTHARVGVEFFGSFHNVELLPQEYRTLVEQYGEALVNETIESLSCKLMDGNAQSIHHYATLQSWLRHSYKTAPTTPANETEEQSIRHTWDTLTPQEQEQHLKEHGGLYPWQDPKYNKSLRTKDNGKTK